MSSEIGTPASHLKGRRAAFKDVEERLRELRVSALYMEDLLIDGSMKHPIATVSHSDDQR